MGLTGFTSNQQGDTLNMVKVYAKAHKPWSGTLGDIGDVEEQPCIFSLAS
jgi:hypothetical protein